MKILQIAFKDILQSLRSVFMIGMTVIAPVAVTGLMYMAFGGLKSGTADIPDLMLGIVNNDRAVSMAGVEQQKLGDLIQNMFTDESVSGWLSVQIYPDEQVGRQAVLDQQIGVLIILPTNLSQAVFEGSGDAQIAIIQDPTLTITPSVIRNMIVSFLDGVNGGRVAYEVISSQSDLGSISSDPVAIAGIFSRFQSWYVDFQRALFHSPTAPLVVREPSSADFTPVNFFQRMLRMTMVGQMIFFAFFTAAFAMQTIIHEEEAGTLPRLFTTPTTRLVILSGKILAVLLTVLLQTMVLLIIGRLLFGIEWGHAGKIATAVFAQIIAASGLAVLLISLVKNSRQLGPVMGGGMTVLGMLGGLFTAAIDMPAGFALVNKFTPHGWVMQTWNTALSGEPFATLLLPAGISLLIGVSLFGLGALFFNRRYTDR